MGTINTYTAYHATDKSNVANILINNFTFKCNETHWLGNGSYFFLDVALARNWAHKPTDKYGDIINPVIFKVKIKVDNDYTLDMRTLDTYDQVKQYYAKYAEGLLRLNKRITNASYKKIRCAFFNWLIEQTGAKCIIAYFCERQNLSEPINQENEFNKLKIPYIEVQICVIDNRCIVERKVSD